MRRPRILAATGAVALAAMTLGATPATRATAATAPRSTAAGTTPGSFAVLAERTADVDRVVRGLRAEGATVLTVNRAIGLVTVRSARADFARTARGLDGVRGAARDGVVGRSPDARVGRDAGPTRDVRPNRDDVLRENQAAARPVAARTTNRTTVARPPGGGSTSSDPLDAKLWGMDMIHAEAAHAIELGDPRVRVGVMDTGVDGRHPDLAENFDRRLSRNFTTDIPAVDGPCESTSCKDPVDRDDNGHGTHVAGTIGASLNGFGLSGVAPRVDLVNVRAGQDSGFFFLGPTANALTYSGDAGLDVVNMSFYVDPWLYSCEGGAPEDSPEQAAEQDLVIETMQRALAYAHGKGVTLVGALGNNHEDLAAPRTDTSSPDYPGGTEHPRTIDNATCWDLPVEGPYVIGVSSLGPSGRKSDFSNHTTDLASDEIELSAPGGWFRDGLGTPTYRTNGNQILSTAPLHVLRSEGQVDAGGNVTPLGQSFGTTRQCGTVDGVSVCGYYQYLQGTSMAAPHAAGVAALAVSAHGQRIGRLGFGLAPARVRGILLDSATDHACPVGGVQSYADVGRDAEFTATCTGTAAFNGFYGAGIVDALGAVTG
ncbi:S8 family serine peptidase [Oryzobacter sp. R7]|uniref:S8 family serine peptidase n=1 Tax=Oryzobacter faecalis TaxID=3388656 RepID=UPI00398D32FB